jgi:hypothetical protein
MNGVFKHYHSGTYIHVKNGANRTTAWLVRVYPEGGLVMAEVRVGPLSSFIASLGKGIPVDRPSFATCACVHTFHVHVILL